MADTERAYGIRACKIDRSKVDLEGREIELIDPTLSENQIGSDGVGVSVSVYEKLMTPGVDRRRRVDDFSLGATYSSMVMLVLQFEVYDYANNKVLVKEYFGSGQILNMNLEDGSVSKCFIQTCAHNFVNVDRTDGSVDFAVGATAYLRMKDAKTFDKAIPVTSYIVYDKYLDKPLPESGYDYAIASIDIDSDVIAAKTWTSKFNTLPSLSSKLKAGHKIRVCGYPGEEKKRYQPWQMEGTISQIIMKEENHGLIIYKNIDTSCGQSGSMILLIEDNSKVTDMVDKKSDDLKSYPIVNRVQDISSHDSHVLVKPKEIRMDGTNIGVHVAGIEGSKNWGTLLTPTIMTWTRKIITSGDFWEGTYHGSSFNAIGCEGLLLDARTWHNLGCEGGGLGKSKRECYEEALRLNPNNSESWNGLGYVGGGLGKSERECYEEALCLDPNNSNAWRNLGTVGGGLGKSKKECIEEAIRLDSRNSNAWVSLGHVGGGFGKSDKECFEEALRLKHWTLYSRI